MAGSNAAMKWGASSVSVHVARQTRADENRTSKLKFW